MVLVGIQMRYTLLILLVTGLVTTASYAMFSATIKSNQLNCNIVIFYYSMNSW